MTELNLSKFVPFDFLIDKETNLVTKANEIPLDFATRKLFDMKEVIYDKEWLKEQDNFDLYYMYRDLTISEHKSLFNDHNIRFDVTIIPPNMLGKEYVKTAGHFHPTIKGNISFPEVYEVMAGKGLYLLQKNIGEDKEIEIIIIEAEAGDQVLIPPGYGHITINPTKEKTLVMNNLVSSEFNSIYGSIKEKQGAAYLYLKDNKWIKNENYNQEINVNKRKPKKITKKPFYISFLDTPEFWKFLNEPWTKDDWK